MRFDRWKKRKEEGRNRKFSQHSRIFKINRSIAYLSLPSHLFFCYSRPVISPVDVTPTSITHCSLGIVASLSRLESLTRTTALPARETFFNEGPRLDSNPTKFNFAFHLISPSLSPAPSRPKTLFSRGRV